MACSQVEVDVLSALASEYLVPLLVHFGSVSGSSALFVGRFRMDIALLMPASASENALCRELLCWDSCAPDVE